MFNYIKKMIIAVGKWFVTSSKNPENLSLTIKSGIPFLVLFGIKTEILNSSTDSVIQLIINIGQVITGIITAIGFVRKILISTKAVIDSIKK